MHPGHDRERIIHLIVIETTGVSPQILLYLFQDGGHFVCYHDNGGSEWKKSHIFFTPLDICYPTGHITTPQLSNLKNNLFRWGVWPFKVGPMLVVELSNPHGSHYTTYQPCTILTLHCFLSRLADLPTVPLLAGQSRFLPDVPLNRGNVPLFVRSRIFFRARNL